MKVIKTIFTITIPLLMGFSLVACGGGGGSSSSTSDTPTDTSIVFSAFPSTYFGGNYSATYTLNGSFSNGDNVTATWNIQSGSTTTFNSQSVTTIDELLSITNTTTSATSGGLSETYYSTDTNNLTLQGGYRTIDGVSSMATSTTVIPLSGTIGDFGMVGNYTLSDGTSSSTTWALEDGFNGKAKLVTTTTIRDSSNALYATSVYKWLITQDGTRESFSVTVTYHQTNNLTLTMSGNKS